MFLSDLRAMPSDSVRTSQIKRKVGSDVDLVVLHDKSSMKDHSSCSG